MYCNLFFVCSSQLSVKKKTLFAPFSYLANSLDLLFETIGCVLLLIAFQSYVCSHICHFCSNDWKRILFPYLFWRSAKSVYLFLAELLLFQWKYILQFFRFYERKYVSKSCEFLVRMCNCAPYTTHILTR